MGDSPTVPDLRDVVAEEERTEQRDNDLDRRRNGGSAGRFGRHVDDRTQHAVAQYRDDRKDPVIHAEKRGYPFSARIEGGLAKSLEGSPRQWKVNASRGDPNSGFSNGGVSARG